jgi:adenine-specific DNA-methyltransferase
MKKQKTKTTIEQYEHIGSDRPYNPPVGLVDANTDKPTPKKKTYQYDPHLDPQLIWAGKAENNSFDVPTVSLHVHERIDPRRIISAIRKEQPEKKYDQPSLFENERKHVGEALEFYKHRENWSNRLVAGDSLLVMNSLIEKEGMSGKVQMVYFDPPYGIKYGSNFQPFVNKRDVKDGSDSDLSAEPETIKAFRDTWELGIHSYLTYLRDRLMLIKELLSESGSIFFQISDENVHLVRCIMDEVFGVENEVSTIAWKKGSRMTRKTIRNTFNYLLWYAKDVDILKSNKLYYERVGNEGTTEDPRKLALWGEFDDVTRTLTTDEKRNILQTREKAKVFRIDKILERGNDSQRIFEVEINGEKFTPSNGFQWMGDKLQIQRLIDVNRIIRTNEGCAYKFHLSDYPIIEVSNLWDDTAGNIADMIYVVQTNEKIIQRCMLMSTDPGDLVLDITCGSGTTAFVAEQWGRRWITCDTSRVAITLAKQRLLTATFDYYELAHPNEGVDSGFRYKTVPHITLKSIANNDPPPFETLYDQPFIDPKKKRVTGPFTVEAVPAPFIKSLSDIDTESVADVSGFQNDNDSACKSETSATVDRSISRSGETLRQDEWRSELLRTGVRGKGGAHINFTRVEPLHGTKYLQAEAETREDIPKRVVVCFGPEFAPLERRVVELALQEVRKLQPKPEIILFCAFQFDPHAANDIESTIWHGVTLLSAQMNADLQTDDLKKNRSSNESFWLIGQPDVTISQLDSGEYIVEVHGFDYYNPKDGKVESGGKGDIAMWMLDHDYDGRSIFPSQVFFPMSSDKDGWNKLARNLKAEIDEEKIEVFRGTKSLPFKAGVKVAVKIIDARGIESMREIQL